MKQASEGIPDDNVYFKLRSGLNETETAMALEKAGSVRGVFSVAADPQREGWYKVHRDERRIDIAEIGYDLANWVPETETVEIVPVEHVLRQMMPGIQVKRAP